MEDEISEFLQIDHKIKVETIQNNTKNQIFEETPLEENEGYNNNGQKQIQERSENLKLETQQFFEEFPLETKAVQNDKNYEELDKNCQLNLDEDNNSQQSYQEILITENKSKEKDTDNKPNILVQNIETPLKQPIPDIYSHNIQKEENKKEIEEEIKGEEEEEEEEEEEGKKLGLEKEEYKYINKEKELHFKEILSKYKKYSKNNKRIIKVNERDNDMSNFLVSTIQNSYTNCFYNTISHSDVVQSALEYNQYMINKLIENKANMPKNEYEHGIILLWENLKKLSKNADAHLKYYDLRKNFKYNALASHHNDLKSKNILGLYPCNELLQKKRYNTDDFLIVVSKSILK